mmetsp:Transcript_9950/g.9835  ORF Transcript_9950/g.9835 Transcript_9950/m.9835 type:complete len:110 (+) Transcript_9950:236-565(+)
MVNHSGNRGGSNYSDENNVSSNLPQQSVAELQKELAETKDKLKIITNKFITVRKERDQLKQENKELQDEVMHLQVNMRQMVPCSSNTSSAFPMLNELQNIVSEFYKCDC